MLTTWGRAVVAALWCAVVGLSLWLLEGPRFGAGARMLVASTLNPGAPPVDVPGLAPLELLERLPVTRRALDALSTGGMEGEAGGRRLFESVHLAAAPGDRGKSFTVEYTLDAELSRRVFGILRRHRVELGHVIVLDPATGRLLAYASTDADRFSPTRDYPAASLVKVITAAAALERSPELAKLPCRYRGNRYKLSIAGLDPPARGQTVSLRQALATSNNQCFAQLAVHAVGAVPLLESIRRFGWLESPAPAHAAGFADAGTDRLQLGRLGSGLAGARITPLHAAQLAAVLVDGELVTPRWIEKVVDSQDRLLEIPTRAGPRRVLSWEVARQLRGWLVATTSRGDGTAHDAFFDSKGRSVLGDVRVAGKTGSLRGKDPEGLYQWFIGVAPADAPQVAVATLLVQGDLFWKRSSEVAAQVLQALFCDGRRCKAEYVGRFVGPARSGRGPVVGEAGLQQLPRGPIQRVAGAPAPPAGARHVGPNPR